MKTKLEYPLYELKIDEEQEAIVNAVSLVKYPAIERNFLSFSKDELVDFIFSSDEKMELIGPALIPNEPILKIDKKTKEKYYVYFSSETIRQIAQTYLKRGFQTNLNIEHSTVPAKSFIYQSFIVDNERGIQSPKGMNLPDGSWVVGIKVLDSTVWQMIKKKEVEGFSVEGLFEFIESKAIPTDDAADDLEVFNILKQITNIINKNKKI
jgi:hypothetical protein